MIRTIHYDEYASYFDMDEDEIKEEAKDYIAHCKSADKINGVSCKLTVLGKTAELNVYVTVDELDEDFEDVFEDNYLLEDYVGIKEQTLTEIKNELEYRSFTCN